MVEYICCSILHKFEVIFFFFLKPFEVTICSSCSVVILAIVFEFHLYSKCMFLITCLPNRRTVISIPNGPSELAVKEAAWGLARYAAISQVTIK